MLFNGYDDLMDKVIANTERMVEVNSVEKLAMGYKSAKKYIEEIKRCEKKHHLALTKTMLDDIERCETYCDIVDGLQIPNGVSPEK